MKKKRIFLIDDEKEILEVYQAILNSTFEVHSFESPASVIKAIESGDLPDIFVTDMKMPGMTGTQLIQWARKRGVEHPFVIVSGYAERSEAFDVLKLGMVELLEKPFSMDLFRLMIQRAVTYRMFQEFRNRAMICSEKLEEFLKEMEKTQTFIPETVPKLRSYLAELAELGKSLSETPKT